MGDIIGYTVYYRRYYRRYYRIYRIKHPCVRVTVRAQTLSALTRSLHCTALCCIALHCTQVAAVGTDEELHGPLRAALGVAEPGRWGASDPAVAMRREAARL